MKILNNRDLKSIPADAVFVDRSTPWGNPFVIGRDGDRNEVITKFADWVTTSDSPQAVWIRDNIGMLRGHDLICWCAPLPCHATILRDMAAEQPSEAP